MVKPGVVLSVVVALREVAVVAKVVGAKAEVAKAEVAVVVRGGVAVVAKVAGAKAEVAVVMRAAAVAEVAGTEVGHTPLPPRRKSQYPHNLPAPLRISIGHPDRSTRR